MNILLKWALAAWCALPFAVSAMSFDSSDFYSSSGSAINQYMANGALIGSFAVSGPEARGLAFGSDGNLYVTRNNTFGIGGTGSPGVDVFDAQGDILRHYSFPGWIGGLVTAGNIVFNPSGQKFYVSALDGVYQFDVSGTTGTKLIDTAATSVAVMPNGDLLVASGNSLARYSSTGALLSSVLQWIDDPLGLTTSINDLGSVLLVDVRGIVFDAARNTTYVSMLGYSGGLHTAMSFKILALAGFSSTLTGIQSYWYGSDLYVTREDQLLVGSWTQSPGIFSTAELNQAGSFDGPAAIFVTAGPIPEPSSAMLLLVGLVAVPLWAKGRKRR